MSIAIQAAEERHGPRRYKLWATSPAGDRHYLGAYKGVVSLARAIVTHQTSQQDGAVLGIQVVRIAE